MEKFYLNENEYPEGVSSITKFDTGEYPSVVDRYFTRFYHKKTSEDGNENEDHLILYHSNRVCLIGLAQSHIAFKKGIVGITYNIGNCDRSLNQVKGKHKKGGMNLQPLTTLAIITCKDGSEYKVLSCVTGKLIETNDRLKGNLNKLSIEGSGYVAIVLIKPENCEKAKSSLVSEKDYIPSCSF
ncbi:CLUMA_CG008231, isoform A [Clunio marinus]|uniref:CLUMA_CG008231, isoform A n=1 Tax=Clunio marinus TaxID=568069 RepID=A0A1J1I4P4_9DIPT|nr:CLUMA_CG008231, isoform A [Clunio marinus]